MSLTVMKLISGLMLFEVGILPNIFASYEHNYMTVPSPPNSSKKIVGGKFCSTQTYPFMVGVFGEISCGGSLITLQWVVTAGHCVVTESSTLSDNVAVRSGLNTGESYFQIRDAKKVVVHKKYDIIAMDSHIPELRYDIGLILVQKPFTTNSWLSTVKLPSPGFTRGCTEGTVVGTGIDHVVNFKKTLPSRPLKCVTLHIVNSTVCSQTYPGSVIDDTIVCTMETKRGKDACQGDSGGPLLCKNVLIGIVSYGIGCGLANKAATFTKVESFLDFINETISKSKADRNDNFQELLCVSIVIYWIIH